MASFNLTSGKLVEPALVTLDIPGDHAPGGWYSEGCDAVGEYGARLADLGCDEATVAAINAGSDALLSFRDLAAPDGVEFDDSSLLRFGVDANGGLAGVSMPLIKADSDGALVCCIGDNVLSVQENESEFTLGQLAGRLETEAQKEYTAFRIRFSSKATGDRYLVKVFVRDGVGEDEVLDAVEAGQSIAPLLKVVGQGGVATNMADLPLGTYDVVGVKTMKGAEGRPDWYILKLAGGLEVKSRSKTDATLRTGLNVDFIRSKGNFVLLQVTGKSPYGENRVQVDCGLTVAEPERAKAKLAATAAANAESAAAAPAAKRPATPAPKAAPAAAPVEASENPAAKAAAARKSKAAVAVAAAGDNEVNLDF